MAVLQYKVKEINEETIDNRICHTYCITVKKICFARLRFELQERSRWMGRDRYISRADGVRALRTEMRFFLSGAFNGAQSRRHRRSEPVDQRDNERHR